MAEEGPQKCERPEDSQIGGKDEVFSQDHGSVHQGEEGDEAEEGDRIGEENGEVARVAEAIGGCGGNDEE